MIIQNFDNVKGKFVAVTISWYHGCTCLLDSIIFNYLVFGYLFVC